MVGSVGSLGVLEYLNQFVKRSLLKSKKRTWSLCMCKGLNLKKKQASVLETGKMLVFSWF